MTGCATAPTRRGAALLLVLAVMIIIITVLAGIAQIVSIRRFQHGATQSAILADELLPAAEGAILEWLERRASSIVLPEDATEPIVPVLNDRWSIEGRRFTLRITAWDQCGMAPMERTRLGSIIRTAIAHDVLRAIDELERNEGDRAGLDQFVGRSSHVRAFPVAPAEAPVTFGLPDGRDHMDVDDPVILVSRVADPIPALGGLIATHNRAPHRININTAPLPLVEAALRATGRGGIESIISARRGAGGETPAPIPAWPRNTTTNRSPVAEIHLVESSDAWSFRIDAEVDDVQRSWWVVYERTLRPRRGEPSWYRAQRLVITEP